MTSRDPNRLLRTIRRTTAGSLVAAALGSGVVAVHLASDQASAAAASRADGARAVGQQAATPRPAAVPTPEAKRTTPAPTKRKRHHTASRSTARSTSTPTRTRSFAPVAPVQPSKAPPQSSSGGS
ncbi:hypothetical protein ABEG17_03180 [Pedococcus sp. KACC 23699]|uniref:Uncharacterized protein n=1 Tax=Pedococcus sp. KACC 23699 TaxID=3149228 RepID=A0AAU7JWU2_9MICO